MPPEQPGDVTPQQSALETFIAPAPPDYSMVLGGPLFQFLLRARLTGTNLEWLPRRILVITAFAWLPLLLLSLVDGRAWSGVKIPFLFDLEAHSRFLVALPVLILAEVVAHRRIRPAIRRFVDRGIVTGADVARLAANVDAALKWRNSIFLEVSLLLLCYTLGAWIWRTNIVTGPATWYSLPSQDQLHLTPAGYWYAFLSVPTFQFLLLRWYVRLVIWFRLLWQVSRMDLRLTAAHPDRAGGIGFLGSATYAFGPILFAHGALLSGLIGNRVVYDGQDLMKFKMEAIGLVVFLVLSVCAPLTMFTAKLDQAKRKGSAEFGALCNQYMFGFEEKWIRRGAQDTDELLGTSDIQSLADLGNSYSVVSEMRLVPFKVNDLIRLGAATAAPLAPLALTVFSFEEAVTRLLKLLV